LRLQVHTTSHHLGHHCYAGCSGFFAIYPTSRSCTFRLTPGFARFLGHHAGFTPHTRRELFSARTFGLDISLGSTFLLLPHRHSGPFCTCTGRFFGCLTDFPFAGLPSRTVPHYIPSRPHVTQLVRAWTLLHHILHWFVLLFTTASPFLSFLVSLVSEPFSLDTQTLSIVSGFAAPFFADTSFHHACHCLVHCIRCRCWFYSARTPHAPAYHLAWTSSAFRYLDMPLDFLFHGLVRSWTFHFCMPRSTRSSLDFVHTPFTTAFATLDSFHGSACTFFAHHHSSGLPRTARSGSGSASFTFGYATFTIPVWFFLYVSTTVHQLRCCCSFGHLFSPRLVCWFHSGFLILVLLVLHTPVASLHTHTHCTLRFLNSLPHQDHSQPHLFTFSDFLIYGFTPFTLGRSRTTVSLPFGRHPRATMVAPRHAFPLTLLHHPRHTGFTRFHVLRLRDRRTLQISRTFAYLRHLCAGLHWTAHYRISPARFTTFLCVHLGPFFTGLPFTTYFHSGHLPLGSAVSSLVCHHVYTPVCTALGHIFLCCP